MFRLAPYLSIMPAFLMFCVVPIGGTVSILGHETYLQVADLPIGALLHPRHVGPRRLRRDARRVVVGFEVPAARLGARHRAAALVRSRVRPRDPRRAHPGADAVDARDRRSQQAWPSLDSFVADWYWLPRSCRSSIFLIAATAETNHPPFDLVEAEQELVGGFNTEYTGIRFAIFFLAEFMNVITMSAIATTLFLGGPSGPSLGFLGADSPVNVWLMPMFWFTVKVLGLLFVHRVVARVAAAHALRPAHGARLEVPDRDRDPLGARVDRVAGRPTGRDWHWYVVAPCRRPGIAILAFFVLYLSMPKPGEFVEEFH